MNPFQALSAAFRKKLYLAFGVVGLVPTVVSTYQIAVGQPVPAWCIGVAAVVGVLAPALGFTAGANVVSDDLFEADLPGEFEGGPGEGEKPSGNWGGV